MGDLKKRLGKAPQQPAPISMKKPRRKKAAVVVPDATIEPFNMDAPEHEDSPLAKLNKKRLDSTVDTVKELKAAVKSLGARQPEIVVQMPVRPRIERISIEYDDLGHPKALVPAYGE